MDEDLKALEAMVEEITKLKNKYGIKADKERAKINDISVVVCGEKCYTEQDILDWYAGDYITMKQADKYIEKLDGKKAKAGEKNNKTKNERAVFILQGILNTLYFNIKSIKVKQENERKFNERLEIAKQQGLSYKQFLELEEISRQSEEYERMMGIN